MRTFKIVVSAALALASSAVLAQPSVPTQPVAGPTPEPDSGNGGIIVSAYDSTRGLSITEYVGLKINDFLPNSVGGTATPDSGLVLDFGTVSGWGTVFGSDSAANAGIHYSVTGFDDTKDDPLNGTYIGKRMITTLIGSGTALNVRNTALNSAALNAQTFIGAGLNGTTQDACAGGNPCNALTALEPDFAGQAGWGDKLGNALAANAGGAVNSQLAFYLYAANSDNGATTLAPRTQFSNANGNAFWLLTDTGHLTYVVPGGGAVPLPAAIWLLLSGLASFGVIGRGRRGAVAAA
jgi:hypothetical protein